MKHLPKIIIRVIPQKKQRYKTEGDYFEKNGTCYINISKLDREEELLIAVHEIIEWFLTKKHGITEEEITRFDIKYGTENPGRSKKAPYHKEHMFCEKIERLIKKELKKKR